MVNVQLLWWILIPIALSIATVILLPRLNEDVDYKMSGIISVVLLVISAGIIAAAFYIGKGSKTKDQELWNGMITGKSRVHDTYEQAYQCNCVESCSTTNGQRSCSTTCQTCYETHYTVTWSADSTLGRFRIDHEDSTSRRVYKTPDPALYTRTQVGEPCAQVHGYTNYIKAVPESLFKPSSAALKHQFAKLIPTYPMNIYGLWRVDRALAMGVNVPDIGAWSRKLSLALIEMGPKKQANAIVLIVNTADPNYMYALQDAWVGAKKNDIVLVIGATKFPNKADWVGVLALTDNEMFKIKLRDDILALDTLNMNNVIDTLKEDTMQLFKRKSMHDFAYLDAEIDPPTWMIVTALIVVALAYIGCWYFMYQQTSNSSSIRGRQNSFTARRKQWTVGASVSSPKYLAVSHYRGGPHLTSILIGGLVIAMVVVVLISVMTNN